MPGLQPIVLIIDDSPTALHTTKEFLSQFNFNVQTAGNGAEGLALARSQSPDVILIDNPTPGLDGFAHLKKIRADPELADIPVLLLTAVESTRDRLHVVEAGADDLLIKPFDNVELLARVKMLVRLKTYGDKLHRMHAQMEERLRLLQTLFVIAMQLHDSVDAADVYRVVREALSAIVGAQAFTVFMREDESPMFRRIIHYGLNNVAMPETLNEFELPSPIDAVVKEGRTFYHEGSLESAPKLFKQSLFACVPILFASPQIAQQNTIGVINVHAFQASFTPRVDFETLNLLSGQVAGAVHSARRYNQLRHSVQELEQSAEDLKQVSPSLEQHFFHLNTLTLFSAQLHSSVYLPDIFAAIRDLAINFIGVEVFAIRYYDEWDEVLTSYIGVADKYDIEELPVKSAGYTALIEQVMDSGVNFFRENPDPIFASLSSDPSWPLACLPLRVAYKVRGVFVIESLLPQKGAFEKQDYELLALMIDEAGVAIHNGLLNRRLERLSFTDGLTGIYNRRYFNEQLSVEVKRACRYERPVALLLCDIDNFKSINDRYGHPVGDEVLKEVAQRMLGQVRDVDIVARYGGEEFAIILPYTTLEGAKQVAERILQSVPVTMEREGQALEIPLTLSLGLSMTPPHESVTNLIAAADNALLQAKRNGKNCVVLG